MIAVVPDDPVKGDWLGYDWERFMKAVNPKLDKMRVLHGAQDQFPNYVRDEITGRLSYGGAGGLTDELAYAVFPDGRAIALNARPRRRPFTRPSSGRRPSARTTRDNQLPSRRYWAAKNFAQESCCVLHAVG